MAKVTFNIPKRQCSALNSQSFKRLLLSPINPLLACFYDNESLCDFFLSDFILKLHNKSTYVRKVFSIIPIVCDKKLVIKTTNPDSVMF